MLDILRSLSWSSGAAIILVCSAILAVFLAQIRHANLRWALALFAPYALAHSLYWAPVWLGADSAEYGSWYGVFVLPWFLFGTAASCLVTLIVSNAKHKGEQQ